MAASGLPDQQNVLQRAVDRAAAELDEDEHHEENAAWLRKRLADQILQSSPTASVLQSFFEDVNRYADTRGLTRTLSDQGRINKLRSTLGDIMKAINTGTGTIARMYSPSVAAFCSMGQRTCNQADGESLAYLTDSMTIALDHANAVGKLLDKAGSLASVEEAVFQLHVIILKFWACAGRRMELGEKRATPYMRQNYAYYIKDTSETFQDDLRKVRESVQKAFEEAVKKAEMICQSRKNAALKLDASVISGSYRQKHDSLQERWQENTCRWIDQAERQEHKQFDRWLNTNTSNFLWIHGAAGMGKTILAWYIIDKALADFTTGAEKLFFYCTHEHVTAHEATAGRVLKSLVSQIFCLNCPDRSGTNRTLSEVISEGQGIPSLTTLFFADGSNDFEKLSSLSQAPSDLDLKLITTKMRALFTALRQNRSIHIILDGLDEYPDQQVKILLRILSPLCGQSTGSPTTPVKLLVFSRPTMYFVDMQEEQVGLREEERTFDDFELPDDAVRDDVRAFLSINIGKHLGSFKYSRLTENEIQANTSIFVNRLAPTKDRAPPFQWAYLVLEALRQYNSLTEIKGWLEGKTFEVKKLNNFYARVLLRLESKLSSGMRDLVTSILVWATYSTKVLTTVELTELLRMQGEDYIENTSFLQIHLRFWSS